MKEVIENVVPLRLGCASASEQIRTIDDATGRILGANRAGFGFALASPWGPGVHVPWARS